MNPIIHPTVEGSIYYGLRYAYTKSEATRTDPAPR